MKRRVVGVVLSVALAAVGVFLVLSYTQSADERALAGEEVVEVLVVDAPVTAGEGAADIENRVRLVQVPVKVQAVGSVASLADLDDRVAAVDLVPGEQVVTQRFVTAEQFEEQDEFEVPDGLLEVTVSLSPDRAVGGQLEPGDFVAVVASFDPFDLNAIEPNDLENLAGLPTLFVNPPTQVEATPDGVTNAQPLKTPNSSHIVLHKVLVTAVQIERLPAEPEREDAEAVGVELAPTGNLLVTLAVQAPDVEKIVFTAEHGFVWLASEPGSASEAGTQIQTRGSIYR